MAGYSGKPLAQKLGITGRDTVAVVGATPPEFESQTLRPLPDGARIVRAARGKPDVVVCFATRRGDLAKRVDALGRAIFPDAMLWVAWPKKASGVATDITEDVVREVALPLGLVDVKVCAIDDTWSGLKLVWRKERRT